MKALLVAAFALGSTIAAAQTVSTLGIQNLHVGPSVTLTELRLGLSSPIQLAPGAGVEADYHFKRWQLGGAVFGSGLIGLLKGSQPQSELSSAVFGCSGSSFGLASGICLGPLVVIAGPAGGLVKGFKWKGSVGLVLSLSPDTLATLSAL